MMEYGNKADNITNTSLPGYKDLFVIVGLSLVGVGMILCVFGVCLPIYKDAKAEDKNTIIHTPIIVDYELPPYGMSLQSGNYSLLANDAADTNSVVVGNDMFQTYLVQGKLQS